MKILMRLALLLMGRRSCRQHELLLIDCCDLLGVVTQRRILLRIQHDKRSREDVLDVDRSEARLCLHHQDRMVRPRQL